MQTKVDIYTFFVYLLLIYKDIVLCSVGVIRFFVNKSTDYIEIITSHILVNKIIHLVNLYAVIFNA